MNFILFDDNSRNTLLPLTFTRPVGEIRIGILTIKEKWEYFTGKTFSYLTEDYLSIKYPVTKTDDNILINGSLLPSKELVDLFLSLRINEAVYYDDILYAARVEGNSIDSIAELKFKFRKDLNSGGTQITRPWQIFSLNGKAIEDDFALITKGRKSKPLSATNKVLAPENVFVEEGAWVECAIINAQAGPVYIGKDAEIMEGSMIRGPFALCEHSSLKLGAKIYGPSTIGPHSKVGGEVNNSVIFGFSNKAHDGFLGNSVIGEWCNIGADSNNSNLKNNYSPVKIWDYSICDYTDTALLFCGLIMGDHSKCGINTMFNTGTVTGVSANIFGSGFPDKYIPSFSWGGAGGFSVYRLSDALETAKRVYGRRNIEFSEIDKNIFEYLFNITVNKTVV